MRQSIILLHGLFGGLSNWKAVIDYFEPTYDVHVPLLPIMDEHKEDELEYLVNWLQRYIDNNGSMYKGIIKNTETFLRTTFPSI